MCIRDRLNWLVENGYDIGNHTYSHKKMEELNSEEIQIEIGSVNNIIKEYLPDYAVETLALPHGSNPKEEFTEYMLEGEYQGERYSIIASLDVGWRPAYSLSLIHILTPSRLLIANPHLRPANFLIAGTRVCIPAA